MESTSMDEAIPFRGWTFLLLTGLSLMQLNELGGYRIVDPITDLVLHQEGLAEHSAGQEARRVSEGGSPPR